MADQPYTFHTDVKYESSTAIDIPAEVAGRAGEWFNQTLTVVNDAALRLAVLNGTYHWHKHDDADELFLVLDGRLFIDIEGRGEVALARHEAYTVPRGVVHRTRATDKCVIVMVEPATMAPTGD